MKAILEFNLPEEQEDYEYAVNGSKLESQINDYDMYLRSMYKYDVIPDDLLEELGKESFTDEEKALIGNLAQYFRQVLSKARREEL